MTHLVQGFAQRARETMNYFALRKKVAMYPYKKINLIL